MALTLTELAEQYGESIDNLPIEVLMEAIYNEQNVLYSEQPNVN